MRFKFTFSDCGQQVIVGSFCRWDPALNVLIGDAVFVVETQGSFYNISISFQMWKKIKVTQNIMYTKTGRVLNASDYRPVQSLVDGE